MNLGDKFVVSTNPLYAMWEMERVIEKRMARARQQRDMFERGNRAIAHKPRRILRAHKADSSHDRY